MIENENGSTLILWDKMKSAITECHSVDEVANIRNQAEAYRYALKQAKESPEVIRKAEEIKLRAERRAGELLKESIKQGGVGANQYQELRSQGGTLADIGISKNQSSKWQKIASIPEDKFENFLSVQKELSTAGVLKVAKIHHKEKQRQERSEIGKTIIPLADIRLGDFEDVLADIPDGSVDCIITDPPYPYEFIECWTKLSRFAAKKLKPNGYCIAYSGQMNLPEVIKRMGEHLDYYWTFALYHQGQTQIVRGANIRCRWKPILIYQNGKKELSDVIEDFVISEKREKGSHIWQQSESGISKLIELFTYPGDLIIEPFAGGGTTITSCMKLNRRVIAAEINKETFNIAKNNINDYSRTHGS